MTMSHNVTIRTQTVTTGSTTNFYVNTGYLRTWSGLCKALQLALGIICVGISSNEFHIHYRFSGLVFFLLMATTFMIGTFILVVSCLASLPTASIIHKTIYEFIYHSFGFALLLAGSLALVTNIHSNMNHYELLLTASICGFLNCALYFISSVISHRGYRSI